jgi:UDP-N-acetylglucosamine:LPS N-acetylglucosamine transferase
LGILHTYAVIVPLAIGNGEQSFNARELEQIGGAVIIPEREFSTRKLSENFFGYIKAAKEYRSCTTSPVFTITAEENLGSVVLATLRGGAHP